MKDIPYNEAAGALIDKLAHGGVFLSVPGNTMTIGWASVGVYWGLPMFVALVRPQRYTYDLLQKAGEYTVSVPTDDPMKAQLAFAGTKSGRDFDKFSGHGLTAAPARIVQAPIVAECGLHFECVVKYTQTLTGDAMNETVLNRAYPERDFHTLFYGEIVACYAK